MTAAYKVMEKNFEKYDKYKAYFEANRQDYPRFIEKDAEFRVVKSNFDESNKF